MNQSLNIDDDNIEFSTITHDTVARTPFEYAAFACSLFMLLCCVIGVFGNACSVLIFTRRTMRSSINVLLMGLSMIDLIMLATSIPVFVVPNINVYFKQKLLPDSYYMVVVFGPYQIGMIAQTCSVWTFVLISVERYLAVCHPLKVSRLLSVRRARVALFGVVTSAICYNIVRFFEYKKVDPNVQEDSDYSDETAASGPGYVTWLRGEPTYLAFYYIGSYLITQFLGPFVTITILNVLILSAMRKSKSIRTLLTSNSQGYGSTIGSNSQELNRSLSSLSCARRSSSKRGARKTTQMIIVVTSMFLFTNLLPFAMNIWEAAMPDLFNASDDQRVQAIAFLMVDLSNALVVFNSASTFLLYIIYCRKYRELFKYYWLMPLRFFTGDHLQLQRHHVLAERSSSFDVSKLMNIVNESTIGRSRLAAATVSATLIIPIAPARRSMRVHGQKRTQKTTYSVLGPRTSNSSTVSRK